jgi:hypothetical protein
VNAIAKQPDKGFAGSRRRSGSACRLSALLRQPSRRESVALPQRAKSRVWQLIPPQRSIAEPATIRCAKPGNRARTPALRNRAAPPEGVASPQSPLPLRRPPRRLRASATVSLKARPQSGCSPPNPSGWLPMRAPTSSYRRPLDSMGRTAYPAKASGWNPRPSRGVPSQGLCRSSNKPRQLPTSG